MEKMKLMLKDKVRKEWIDYNGHMNDAEYVRVFSLGVERFMNLVGIDERSVVEKKYTIYTLESHVCYLDEMKLDEPFEIRLQILDFDEKRTHIFFVLYGKNGKRAATSEQMLMSVDQTIRRSAPFPEEMFSKIKEIANEYTPNEKPKEAGRVIGIKRES